MTSTNLVFRSSLLSFALAAFAWGQAPVYTDATINKNIYVGFRAFGPELKTTAEFKELGIDTRCFFASNTVNSGGTAYCAYPPIWKGVKHYNFAAYDKQVEDLLSANPHARFICMIDLNTPYWLTRRFAFDSFDDISHAASNKAWLDLTTQWMLDFIVYSEKKYGDKIRAYVLAGGGTTEWYEFGHGHSSCTKNAAWREWQRKNGLSLGPDVPPETTLAKAAHENVVYDPTTEMAKIQYWRFHNELIADAVLHFSEAARRKIPAGKEIGVYFGYYYAASADAGVILLTSFGHLDYERVFASRDIDFFMSPGTYRDRVIGGGSGAQLVLGTALRYGKRYLHEVDHAPHCVSHHSSEDFRWKTQADDNAGLAREAAFALINHASMWWFDMFGGWYQNAETRQLIKRFKTISDRYVQDRSPSVAESLLIADPQSAYYVNERTSAANAMRTGFRKNLNRTGTPFDVYSFNDIPVIDLSRYKVVFLPATFLITPERAEVLKRLLFTKGRTVVWAYAPGICDGKTLDKTRVKQWAGCDYGTPGPTTTSMGNWTSVYAFEYKTMTPAVLRTILEQAGVHLYTDGEEPVYANKRLLAVHVKNGGKKTIRLPRVCMRVVDVIHGNTIAENVEEFDFTFKTPDTALFELVR
jgi:hypothetical protein